MILLGSLLEETGHCPIQTIQRRRESHQVGKSCPVLDSAAERDQKDLVD